MSFLDKIKLTNKKEAKESSQEDVPLNIAVMLSMNPYKPISTVGKDFEKYKKERKLLFNEIDKPHNDEIYKVLFKKLTNKEEEVFNFEQFKNLEFWMKYFGFISHVGKNVIPDPTEAIARNISSIFNSKNTLQIDVFQKILGERIPVLEGGDVREIIEANTKEEFRRKDPHFSKSTSLALRRLMNRGVISFQPTSDYKQLRILDWGTEEFRVEQIEYKKEINA